jgi:hypothetical protein
LSARFQRLDLDLHVDIVARGLQHRVYFGTTYYAGEAERHGRITTRRECGSTRLRPDTFKFSILIGSSNEGEIMANTWTPLANQNGFANGMWLLQDGRVLVNVYTGAQLSTQLFFLSPDANGSYVNRQFDSSAGNFLAQKAQFASVILSDGRLVTCGGESGSKGPDTSFCEIYDPTTLPPSSSSFPPPAGWSSIGDSPAIVLTDGTVLLANALGQPAFATLNQYSLTWTEQHNIFSDNEYGLVLLQTGDVLKASVTQQTSYRYNAGTNAFVKDADPKVVLGSTQKKEIGPAMTLKNHMVRGHGSHLEGSPVAAPAGPDGDLHANQLWSKWLMECGAQPYRPERRGL